MNSQLYGFENIRITGEDGGIRIYAARRAGLGGEVTLYEWPMSPERIPAYAARLEAAAESLGVEACSTPAALWAIADGSRPGGGLGELRARGLFRPIEGGSSADLASDAIKLSAPKTSSNWLPKVLAAAAAVAALLIWLQPRDSASVPEVDDTGLKKTSEATQPRESGKVTRRTGRLRAKTTTPPRRVTLSEPELRLSTDIISSCPQIVTVSWRVGNAVSAFLNEGDRAEGVPLEGERAFQITTPMRFSLTATGPPQQKEVLTSLPQEVRYEPARQKEWDDWLIRQRMLHVPETVANLNEVMKGCQNICVRPSLCNDK